MTSAIILTKNNESSIEQALKSILWCDEIICIDDFSTDKTLDIAKQYNAVIYQRALKDNFAAQRNFGLAKAKGDWVLYIDSDEKVSKALAKEIQKSVSIDCAGFYVRRQDSLFGKKLLHGETSRSRFLRLAKKNAGIWIRPVHEVWETNGLLGQLQEPLDHFPHPNVAQFIDDINVYSTLNAKYFFEKKTPVAWWHIIAYPAAKFFVDYIWFFGFLDGTAGAIMAIVMSMHSFLTRAKLWLLWHPAPNKS